VLLGSFRRVTLSGVDLLVSGNTTLAGESVFSVNCGSSDGQPFIDFGAGKKMVRQLEIASPGGFLQVNGRSYRNRLTIHAKGEECAVVNTVDLEKYLAGLINREMAPSWPVEAMKAQAVASRSYALYQAQIHRDREYDVEGTTQDQVYDGAASETAKSNRAAEDTRGEIISFKGNAIKAYFHANCGGRTELPGAVWGNRSPAFRPVTCPYHRKPRDRLLWSTVLTRVQLEQAVKKVSSNLPNEILRVAKLEAGSKNNQRLSEVVVSDAKGKSLVIPANAFRNAVGNTKLKSTSFRIHPEGESFRLFGEGFGHGVGMCQIGARAMAEEGKNYRQILSHYYPLAQRTRF
jgi:stage II sporulation protein D